MADPGTGLPPRPRVRLYVFSISVDWQRLREALALDTADGLCCAVTPHHLFPGERERLRQLRAGTWVCKTFHDLLECADMEFCDAEADRVVLARRGRREGHVDEYYAEIKRLKNECAVRRLQKEFEVTGGAILCGDLGIRAESWRELGLADLVEAAKPSPQPRHSKLRRLFFAQGGGHYLDWKGQRWLLVGRPERLLQYLDQSTVTLRPLGKFTSVWFGLQMRVVLKLKLPAPLARTVLRIANLPWALCHRSVAQVAATIHEDNVAVARLAESLGLAYVNLQDSFLPGYYPSRYLLYRPAVRRFYVWDNLSRGIFERHGLVCSRWTGYRSWKLPLATGPDDGMVRRILYLSSGAGDWTALKNRSDEDLALALLAEVARARPDLTIHYRPHPLWLHPDHQGLNSIDRVIDCVAAWDLPNLVVSHGSRTDARRFSVTGNLSSVSSSVDEDIDGADLVLGEHSQTILVAALRGKIIAGINPSKHPAFFSDYAALGFPLVSSAGELLELGERINQADSRARFLADYNGAIARHNEENGDATEAPV